MSMALGTNAINRVIDANIDMKNPRTALRQIPQGFLSKKEVIIFSSRCFLLMVVSVYMLNPICAMLSPLALFLLIIYSYTKRLTWLCHLVLDIVFLVAGVLNVLI